MQKSDLDCICDAPGPMAAPASLQELARSNIKVLAKGKGGNTKFVCTHCRKEFTGSLTRQLAHLTGTSGIGIAACNDSDLIQDHRDAIKLEVERLERTKSGSRASSSQLSGSGSCEGPVRCCCHSYTVMPIPLFVQILLRSALPKGSDSQQLSKH